MCDLTLTTKKEFVFYCLELSVRMSLNLSILKSNDFAHSVTTGCLGHLWHPITWLPVHFQCGMLSFFF